MANWACETVYFENAGEENTGETLRLAKRRAEERGINTIVVATTYGNTCLKALEMFAGSNVICVTHCTGFREPNVQFLSEETRTKLQNRGATVLTCTHAFGGVGRGIKNKLQAHQIDEIIAHVLRIFGQGTKVGIEIVLMAADAGLIRTDADVISIAGTHSGADTALVIRPANTHNFLDLKVREIICKPRL